MEMIRLDNRITAAQIASRFSITTRSAQRELTALKRAGIIIRTGADNGGYWEII